MFNFIYNVTSLTPCLSNLTAYVLCMRHNARAKILHKQDQFDARGMVVKFSRDRLLPYAKFPVKSRTWHKT